MREPEAAVQEADGPTTKSTNRVDILVVDDQPQKLLTYEAVLAPLEENLLRAGSGREALEVLLKREVAVILLDVVMPEMDGFELARIIRQHPRFQQTPIIFVTALSTSDDERLKGYELGAVDYVSVPIVPQILRAKVAVFVELHRKSAALRDLNRELEGRVAERTAELAGTAASLRERNDSLEREVAARRRLEGELRERAAKLAEADRLKSEFLAMLGHELRNPLATVWNAIEILRLETSDEAVRSRARAMAERQVEHLTRLLDDLLDVSRITRGKIALHKQPLLMREAIDHVVEVSRDLIRARNHELKVGLPVESLWVDADPTRLEQILLNLLSNAAKYTQPGGHIALTVEHKDVGVVIRVKDDGVGMDAETLPRVFELFAQGSRSLDRSEGGLGIGLTLVRRLVDLHDGTVVAFSDGPGRGSEFVVTLPVLAASFADLPRRSSAPSERGVAAKRVLVVEDNVDVAITLSLLLETLGHHVTMVHDGEAALKVASENPLLDMVLMDIGLPGMDGYEVARQLRASRRHESLRLVALTGYVRESDRRQSQSAGFDHHLAKPVRLDVLESLFAELSAS